MNMLSWNCRGVGNSRTVRELATLVQSHSPKIVFLCETRQKEEKMKRLRSRIGLCGFCNVDSDGLSGGLALYWHEALHVEVKVKTDRYIDTLVRTSDSDPLWRLTCIYGEPRVEDRHRMWSQMLDLKLRYDLPWLVIGDFNEAMWSFEHFSVTVRVEVQMEAFRDTLELCSLNDLGFSGFPYTYDNKRAGAANVRVRPDRAVASNSWRDLYPFNSVLHVVSSCSDHVVLVVSAEVEELQSRKNKCRQFEIMWERDPALPEVIQKAWDAFGQTADLGDIELALNSTMKSLYKWSNKKFGNIKKELQKSRNQLEQLLNMNADRQEIRRVEDKMNELLYKEEMLWLQRSRIAWLKEGDRNTKYFQRNAVWRARKNNSQAY